MSEVVGSVPAVETKEATFALKQHSGKFALQSYPYLGHVQRHDVTHSVPFTFSSELNARKQVVEEAVAKFPTCGEHKRDERIFI